MLKSVLLPSLLLTAIVGLSQSNYVARKITVDDGLSNLIVSSIQKDQQGFMWFGTVDGLNRFDGMSFKVYRHDDNDPYPIGDSFTA